MRIVLISDTHLNEIPTPDGDILIHAGDLLCEGTERELASPAKWLKGLPHRHKVAIAGNHDWVFQRAPVIARAYMEWAGVTYLQDEEASVAGLRIYGSPWQPDFNKWAFNLPRGAALAEKWAMIPPDLDILVTHTPPMGYGDRTKEGPQGCDDLLARIEAAKPKLHVFGHIHDGHGAFSLGRGAYYPYVSDTALVNASVVDDLYPGNRPAFPPFVIEWDGGFGPAEIWEEWASNDTRIG